MNIPINKDIKCRCNEVYKIGSSYFFREKISHFDLSTFSNLPHIIKDFGEGIL